MANDVTLKDIMAYFSTESRPMGPKEMTREWKGLTDQDKKDIKDGLGNGSLTY